MIRHTADICRRRTKVPPHNKDNNSQSDKSSESRHSSRRTTWQFTPELPVAVSPYFQWPPQFKQVVAWLVGGWLPVSERLIILLLALVASLFFQPSPELTADFSFGWIALLYVRNFCLMFFVAGGLHWYFYIAKIQKNERRFDTRPFATSSRIFTFGSQVRDNVFWTLVSGVTVWTLYEALMLWALSNNYAPELSMPQHAFWLVLIIVLIPMWETTHFFLIHRLIHDSRIYQHVHALHHRNTNVGPWSGMSMHPVEHVVYLSTVLIHFIVPSTPFLIAFHLMYFTLSAATTHTGYQGIVAKGKLVLPLGTFHHQLHHRFVTCNYGGLEMPWDKWTGSFHDGTPESHQSFLANRKSRSKN